MVTSMIGMVEKMDVGDQQGVQAFWPWFWPCIISYVLEKRLHDIWGLVEYSCTISHPSVLPKAIRESASIPYSM